ncbi:hypothetical protein KPG66_13165 [Mycetohabitans sp. B2]|uniref:hypothetical protein n=1 Tax=Mycetohabitans sp. B2 TaxID=2841274 RepID=UPI001F34C6B0|nr:hypothetical protein [Mycetohabitans sp. B2]MCF7696996.1 hypothetical protein [Mycetohabitans sp. B2]
MFLAQLLADPTILTKFEIRDEDVSTSMITFGYGTISGNNPNTNKNTVFLWQVDSWYVPEDDTDLKGKHSIDTGSPSGFNDLEPDNELAALPYLIAYAVGDTKDAVVATLRIESQGGGKYTVIPPQDGSDGKLSFELNDDPTTRSVSYRFNAPNGTSAEANGDWVGVWKGSTVSNLYDPNKKPIGIKPLTMDQSSGSDRLTLPNGQSFESGADYMLGYFKSGYDQNKPNEPVRTTLAAVIRFKGP